MLATPSSSNHISLLLTKRLFFRIMSAMVCDVTKENCMHSICKDCPGKEGARSLLDENDLEGYPERVEYKQWVASKKSAGERCRLINANSGKDAFYDEFVDLVYDLKVHHFTAQSQSSFLKEKNPATDASHLKARRDELWFNRFWVGDATIFYLVES